MRQTTSSNSGNGQLKLRGTEVLLGTRVAASAIAAFVTFIDTTLAQDRLKIEAGEAVYNDYCYTCHGEKLVSSGQTYDLRRLTADDRARFENSVRLGKNQMPPWKDVLTNEQIELIWIFIRDNAFQK
jgi:mono/diheme cytochrome c family protein